MILLIAKSFAQTANEKVIVVNSGKFESTAPFQDYVTVGVYNPFSKQYKTIDTLLSQSAQGVLVDGKSGFVIAENKIAKYDFKTEQKIQTGTYQGVSPKSLAVSGNKLFVGNWYGQNDSCLYIYDATTLILQQVVPQITKEVKDILIVGDTAYIAQNIKGTIDYCSPYGCYNDTIGQLALVRVSTGAYIGTINMGTAAAGIGSLYRNGSYIVTVNAQANSVSQFNVATQTFTTFSVPGDLGKGIAFINGEIFSELDGNVGKISLQTNLVTSSNLAPISYPLATVYDSNLGKFYQSVSDYASYGSVVASKQNTILDSINVGISPEALGLYYSANNAPVAVNDLVIVRYDTDTLIDVTDNDIDSNFKPLTVTYVSTPLIFGAQISVDSTTGKIHYTPATGIEADDQITYIVCDGAQLCDTAILYIKVKGVTAIADIDIENVRVYPNPFRDYMSISGINTNTTVSMLSIDGLVIMSEEITSEKIITTSQLPSGVYFIQLSNAKQVKVIKAIKE